MRAIGPQLDAPQVMIAEEQEEYATICGALVVHPEFAVAPGRAHNAVVLAYRPSDDECRRIAAGEDLYVSLLTFGGAMQPIIVLCGKDEAAVAFGVAST